MIEGMKLLFLACLLTVVIETGFFALQGYRGKDDLIIVACANAATNLSLNLLIALVFPQGAGLWLFLLEAAVVVTEYLIYARAFGASRRLFLLTLAANVLSFAAGLLLSASGIL